MWRGAGTHCGGDGARTRRSAAGAAAARRRQQERVVDLACPADRAMLCPLILVEPRELSTSEHASQRISMGAQRALFGNAGRSLCSSHLGIWR